eukprot:maker-scaffold449_size167299-snap-gene-0.17 protein:Tk10589 transcript:maker-scaffold449_size167299-snap-gene-0.17-mRNA-1 annotation:"2-acylglycerol o-acyltransferase 1"
MAGLLDHLVLDPARRTNCSLDLFGKSSIYAEECLICESLKISLEIQEQNTMGPKQPLAKRKSDPLREPFHIMGTDFAPLSLPLERRLQTLAVLIYVSLFMLMSLSTVSTLLYLFFFTSYKWIPLFYVAYMWLDIDTCNQGGKSPRFSFMRRWFLFKYFVKFFPIRLIKTAELDPSRTYLIGSHPHGILCYGIFGAFATDFLNVREVYPGIFPRLITLHQQFWLPGSRELLSAVGAVASTKQGIEAVLRQPSGTAGVLIVGGASEALNYAKDEIKLVLKRRKGFIKLALKNGTPLVPSFTFGEQFVYEQAPNPEGSKLRQFQEWFEKKLRFSPPLFFGRGVFQYTWGIVPFRKPLNVVVGAPIDVQKNLDPTEEEVTELHDKYTKALVDLYDTHNEKYGDVTVKLTIA